MLEDVFKKYWHNVFLLSGAKEITFGDFLLTAEALSQQFPKSKASPVFCVLCDESLVYFYSYMAALLCGGTVVPISPDAGEEGVHEILQIVQPDFVISKNVIPGFKNLLPDLFVSGLVATPELVLDKLHEADMDRDFLITFTSGTTAEPKGVVHSFNNLFKSALAFGAKFKFSPAHRFYHNLSVSYMAGILNQFIMPMLFGCSIVIGKRFLAPQAMRFWDEPVATNANVFWMSPTMLQLLLKLDRGDKGKNYCLENNVTILVGTAPLTVALRKQFEKKYSLALYESYGLTETLFISTNYPALPVEDGCSGYILDGVRPKLENDEELLLDCDWMFLRYFKQEKKSSTTKYFATGDFVQISNEKQLFVVGRKKDLIIKGGINISPGKIEAILGRISDLPEFSIVGQSDEILGEKIVFAYAAKFDLPDSKYKEINSIIIEKLDRFYLVDSFVRLNSIPKTNNGKVNKQELKKEIQAFNQHG